MMGKPVTSGKGLTREQRLAQRLLRPNDPAVSRFS